MANLNLHMGSSRYPLWITDENGKKVQNVSNIVSGDILFGNYAFGYINKENGKFVVLYVGRSESGLAREIIQEMNTYRADNCTHFKYSVARNSTEAYEKECQNYHDFGEKECLNNREHPDKPKDNGHYKCPIEGCEYHE